ncbi:MAG TPA: hypothetical protein VGU45_14290 [Microvirga sp.]|jgi:hypothetical protein|nr:hypothetical protein [Microvirga sp.]
MAQNDHADHGHSSGTSMAASTSTTTVGTSSLLGLGLAGHTEVFGELGFADFLRAYADADRVFFADLKELNNSDAQGGALLFQDGDTLTVITAASGVEAGQPHAQHIHGFEDGREANIPTLAQDDDRDGFIEVAEGAETYGPILLDLTSPEGAGAAGFPRPEGSSYLFAQSYDLSDPVNGPLATLLDEAPLQNREIVIHGLTTLEGQGEGTGNEVDGTAGFKGFLPIASGEIEVASSNEAAVAAFVDTLDNFESNHVHAVDADDDDTGDVNTTVTGDAEDGTADAETMEAAAVTDDSGHGTGDNGHGGADDDGSAGGGTTDASGDGEAADGPVDTFGQLTFSGFLRAFVNADDYYFAELEELNNSDAEGGALLLRDGDQLTVITAATGVEPGKTHVQHIHGFEDGRDSNVPTLAQDDDRDGFIELAEGLETYGPILLNLSSPNDDGVATFPTPSGDSFVFAQTYDLSDPANGALATLLDEAPLENREIVLHGLTTLDGHGEGTPGEVDGTAGYKLVLPIAAGEIQKASSQEALTAFADTLDDFGTKVQINDVMLG